MNAPKVTDLDYINFLVAAPRVVTCTEAARVQPAGPCRAAHDALTRLLHRLEPDTTPLWDEAEAYVRLTEGLLIVDDSTLDKRMPAASSWSITTGRASTIAWCKALTWSRCCGVGGRIGNIFGGAASLGERGAQPRGVPASL